MTKKLSSLIVLTLLSLLLSTLPAFADSKPASSNSMSDMSDMDMSDSPSSKAEPGTSPSEEDMFKVTVQTDPEKPAPNKPVNIMITVENKATGQPVLDAAVNVDMMLMDGEKNSSMPGMSMSSETSLQGQAKLDSMAPGMYSITFTPTRQGEWQQDIHISSPTLGETKVSVSLEVTKAGPNWILIGSVAGSVVLAGILAQFLKRKSNALKEV